MDKKILLTALVLGLVAIILGAFGAHGLKKSLTTEALSTFEVGVRYQMYHALFLLFVSTANFLSLKEKMIIFYLVLIGVLLFSGSIYLLSTSSITLIKTKVLGPITPIGGLFLIASWGYMFYSVLVKNSI
ncbi:DUF423 domain-containing protein [Flavobacterium sediminilitoris]|uniref:DUF423 domain-containing protein n=1 Tax=Flavobacterium sediminilitoris TaxID=2024526 RepID=A0ABY4HUJ1_9FLAO|nr:MULTISPECIES: DUF423 domain-containing protein [Flavobacterium]UOX35229.1 DUF423 domain-containing protein [Flavobacterium sediminilitoris]